MVTQGYGNNQFKGICYKCGEFGHRGSNWPENMKGNQDQSRGRPFCEYCKKPGHTEMRCYHKEENAHLRPEWWGRTNKRNQQNNYKCRYCDKNGHRTKECPHIADKRKTNRPEISALATIRRGRDDSDSDDDEDEENSK